MKDSRVLETSIRILDGQYSSVPLVVSTAEGRKLLQVVRLKLN